ncbi:hypothetical protein C8R47DRAFT_1327301 [Mycena vitilis]|nr:hypothetical protein C8R47DRAFT_1327301 [Mycena vitilis]
MQPTSLESFLTRLLLTTTVSTNLPFPSLCYSPPLIDLAIVPSLPNAILLQRYLYSISPVIPSLPNTIPSLLDLAVVHSLPNAILLQRYLYSISPVVPSLPNTIPSLLDLAIVPSLPNAILLQRYLYSTSPVFPSLPNAILLQRYLYSTSPVFPSLPNTIPSLLDLAVRYLYSTSPSSLPSPTLSTYSVTSPTDGRPLLIESPHGPLPDVYDAGEPPVDVSRMSWLRPRST